MVLLQGLARISQSPSSNALKVEGEKLFQYSLHLNWLSLSAAAHPSLTQLL